MRLHAQLHFISLWAASLACQAWLKGSACRKAMLTPGKHRPLVTTSWAEQPTAHPNPAPWHSQVCTENSQHKTGLRMGQQGTSYRPQTVEGAKHHWNMLETWHLLTQMPPMTLLLTLNLAKLKSTHFHGSEQHSQVVIKINNKIK